MDRRVKAETGERRFDVAIAGGGFAGLALATALARAFAGDMRIAVLDPQFGKAYPGDPNASAIAAGPRRLLEAIGVWPEVEPLACAMLGMRITDARLEDALRPVWLGFDGPLADGEPFAHILPNDDLRAALLQAAGQAGVTLIADGYRRHEAAGGDASITLGSGAEIRATLLVAADGVRSQVRRCAGIRSHGWRYDQAAIVTTVTLPRPHDGLAVQHFLPGGPLALLPLPENRAGVVWSLPKPEAGRLFRLDDAGFEAALTAAGIRDGGLVLAGPRALRPLALHVARAFAAERVALIGDAAHAVHPLAGQGLNLALKDVAALTECLAEAGRNGLDLADADMLARYQRWRRFDSLAMVAATEALARLFRGGGLRRSVRDLGLGLFDRMEGVKRAAMTAAAGTGGDVPRLLRGDMP